MTAADAAATEEDFMLELKNISYEVEEQDSNIAILRDINLIIEDKFVAVTGPNGGGKSTLAKVIAGILTPTSGQIFFDGEDITGLDITERAKKGISFAFQQPVRFKGLTVRDLLTMAYGKPAYRRFVKYSPRWDCAQGIMSIAKSMPVSPAAS